MHLIEQRAKTHGGTDIIDHAPSLSFLESAIYRPNTHQWGGLFDRDGDLIKDAGMYRGPDRHLFLPPLRTAEIPERQNRLEGRYVYLGPIHPHYGHFLLSTFSRLWSVARDGLDGRKILFDSAGHIDHSFEKSYFSTIMDTLQINRDDFCHQASPAWVDDVILPAPSFIELLEAYSEFKRLASTVANNVLRHDTKWAKPSHDVVYLSKSRLGQGVWRFNNELELENALSDMGVLIIYPEQLNFSDQVRLFNSGINIISTMGSGIHTSIFSVNHCNLTILCREDQVVSNFVLIDQLGSGRVDYLYDDSENVGGDKEFTINHELLNPKSTAKSLLDYALSK